MSPEIIIAVITTIGTIVAGYLAVKAKQKTDKQDERATFIDSLLERVDKLENRVDGLGDQVINNLQLFEDEKRKIVLDSEQRIDKLRTEMRRLIDDKDIEISVWRDRYFNTLKEYNELKLTYAKLQIDLAHLTADYQRLQAEYQKRINS